MLLTLRLSPPIFPPSPSVDRRLRLHISSLHQSQLRTPRLLRRRCLSAVTSAPSASDEFDEELGRLLVLLPQEMRRRLESHPDLAQLVEIVMDIGRRPLARFPATGDFVLSDRPITTDDLRYATSQVSSL